MSLDCEEVLRLLKAEDPDGDWKVNEAWEVKEATGKSCVLHPVKTTRSGEHIFACVTCTSVFLAPQVKDHLASKKHQKKSSKQLNDDETFAVHLIRVTLDQDVTRLSLEDFEEKNKHVKDKLNNPELVRFQARYHAFLPPRFKLHGGCILPVGVEYLVEIISEWMIFRGMMRLQYGYTCFLCDKSFLEKNPFGSLMQHVLSRRHVFAYVESHFPHLKDLCTSPASLEAFQKLVAQRGRVFEMLSVDKEVFDGNKDHIAAFVKGGKHNSFSLPAENFQAAVSWVQKIRENSKEKHASSVGLAPNRALTSMVDKEVQLSKEHQQPKPVVHQHQSGSHHSPMVLQQATPVHEHRQGSHCPPPRTVQHPSELQQSTCVHQHEPRSRRPSSSAVQIPLEPQHVMAVHERRSQHPPSGTALASQNVQHPSELQQVLRVARSRLQPGSDESPSGSNTVALRQSPVSAPSLNDGKCKMPMQGTYSLMSKFLRDHVGCGHVLDFGQVFFRDRIGQSLKGFLLETSAEDFPNVREATRKLERLQLPSDPRSQLPRIPLLYPQDVALLLLLHKTLKPSEQECLSDYLQFLKEKNTRELRRIFHALKMLKESGHLPSHDDPKVDEARAALGIR